MPVTVYPAPHPSEPCHLVNLIRNASPEQVLRECAVLKMKQGQTDLMAKFGKIIDSSFSNEEFTDVFPSVNGFVHASIRAYNAHHHLRIRPDDVWISILSQLSIYVNKNAEALRSVFVSHQGKKALFLEYAVIHGFEPFAAKTTEVLSKNVKHPSIPAWIMQEFSTTTPTDRIAAGIIMMATFQSYFKYYDVCMCGLPSVTLLGTRNDWVKLLNAIDRLVTFVPEKPSSDSCGPAAQMTTWVSILKPVLTRFIADYNVGGSGADYLSGWLTAFCFWDEMGKCTYPLKEKRGLRLQLDGAGYARVDWEDVPPGWATVPLELDYDHGVVHKCRMLAGSVGITPFLAKVEGAVGKDGRVPELSKGKRAKEAISSYTKNKEPEDDSQGPFSPSQNKGGIGYIVRKILSCDFNTSSPHSFTPPHPSKSPSNKAKSPTHQQPLSPDALPPTPDQAITLPPYRARPLREPPTLSNYKAATLDYEKSRGGYNAQQSTDDPPAYQLDGLQPRIGWWLWEEEVVAGQAPLPDGLEEYVPAADLTSEVDQIFRL